MSPDALSSKRRNCRSRKATVGSSRGTAALTRAALYRFADEAIGALLISSPPSMPIAPFDSTETRGGSKGSMAEKMAAQPFSLVSESGSVFLELTAPLQQGSNSELENED